MGMGGAGIGAYRGYRREGTAWGAVKGGVFGAGVGYGASRLGSYIHHLPKKNVLRSSIVGGVNAVGIPSARQWKRISKWARTGKWPAAARAATPPPV